MVGIPLDRPAQVDIAILPDPRVLTLDRVQVEMGMKLYHKFSPESVTEHEVLLDTAFQDPHTKEWQVIMLGPRLPVMSRPVGFFVADLAEWEKFYAKRHNGQVAKVAVPEAVPVTTKPRKRQGGRRKS